MSDPARPFEQHRQKAGLWMIVVRCHLVRFRIGVEPTKIDATVGAGSMESDPARGEQLVIEAERCGFRGVVRRLLVTPDDAAYLALFPTGPGGRRPAEIVK